MSVAARRELVRFMKVAGLAKRPALVAGMTASSLRYRPAPERDQVLRLEIERLAHGIGVLGR